MAIKKRPKQDEFTKALKRMAEENPVVAVKWAVEEVTPAYNTGGYYDVDVPERSIIFSPEFDTREEAEEWMGRYEPDKGKYLALVKFTGREYRHISWTRTRIK